MNVVPLTAEVGRATGKGPARRLRAQGKVPGTVYGLSLPAVSVSVDRSELRRALTTPAGINALIQLSYGDQQHYTLVKEIQRHPVRRDPIHVDLQRIDPERPMRLNVPIVMVGEAKKVTSGGGIVEQAMSSLAVSVRPDSIPNEITVDIRNLEIDHAITVEQLQLPDGVTTDVDPTAAVVTASLTRAAMVAMRAAAASSSTQAAGEAGEAGEGEAAGESESPAENGEGDSGGDA
jgi:large subunit ribosomal protein L25